MGQSSIESLRRLKERQEEITDWINQKTEVARLRSTSSQSHDSDSETEVSHSRNLSWSALFYRLARTALPVQALMLLASGISSIAEFDSVYSVVCVVQNTVKHSFEPLLSWPKGPPPH